MNVSSVFKTEVLKVLIGQRASRRRNAECSVFSDHVNYSVIKCYFGLFLNYTKTAVYRSLNRSANHECSHYRNTNFEVRLRFKSRGFLTVHKGTTTGNVFIETKWMRLWKHNGLYFLLKVTPVSICSCISRHSQVCVTLKAPGSDEVFTFQLHAFELIDSKEATPTQAPDTEQQALSHFQPHKSPFSSFHILRKRRARSWNHEWRIRCYRFGHWPYGKNFLKPHCVPCGSDLQPVDQRC